MRKRQDSGTTISLLARTALGTLAGALRGLPNNKHLWSYTIKGPDGSAFMERALLPRIAGHRVIVHHILRRDLDPWLHNHPWRTAAFLIVSGGYTEQRLVGGCVVNRSLIPGDVNRLDAEDFHRVDSVLPNTWTVGIVGERCQDWGFLVKDVGFMPSKDYFARRQALTLPGPL